MTFRPPAKINLHLRVGPPTPDGFHPLLTWMTTVSLFDTLTLTLTRDSRVEMTCDDAAIPTDGSNLVVKAAAALLSRASEMGHRSMTGVSAALHKRIPVGAGLGGGSSDGAWAAIGLNRMLGLNMTPHELSELVARFGSDLSFFCHGDSAVCTGRGQRVRVMGQPRVRHAVLVLPPIHMPTPAVYRKFDELGQGDPESLRTEPDWKRWLALDAEPLLAELVNDLEPPAFAISAALRDLHRRVEQTLARVVRMSGSGSSLFSLFDHPEAAQSAAEQIERDLLVRAVAVELCPQN